MVREGGRMRRWRLARARGRYSEKGAVEGGGKTAEPSEGSMVRSLLQLAHHMSIQDTLIHIILESSSPATY